MRLADFIRGNTITIVQAWLEFATTIPPLQDLPLEEQRYHAYELLIAIAKDLDQPQSKDEQYRKSVGDQTSREAGHTGLNFNSGEHGQMRFGQGLSTHEVVSEFRALRAAVLRLWTPTIGKLESSILRDLTRFNEAIDQSLSKSITRYVTEQNKKIKLLDQLLSTIPDQAYVLDLSGHLLYANLALAEHLKRRPEPLLGLPLAEFAYLSEQRFKIEISKVIEARALIQFEIQTELNSSEHLVYEHILAPVFNNQNEVVAVTGTARDITERKLYDEAIWKQANYDALTGLPNRHLFRDRLDNQVRHAERTGSLIALLFIDLDRFKEVNDALGHSGGDRLLQQVANRIRNCIRAEDTLARLGGDEFTVIIAGVFYPEDVQLIAAKIVTKLAEPFHLDGEQVQISGSIGITLYPRDAMTPEDLVRNADQAMYVAKNAGRSRFRFFADDMQQEATARIRLVADLRHGLAEQEFVVYFQPIVHMKTGEIVKAEALVRWNHPRLGMLLPSAFIGAAEEAGLIAEIDHLVLLEAARRSMEWRGSSAFQISINQSPLAFLETNDADWKVSVLDAIAAAPNSLAVEITESVLLQSSPQVLHRIACLRKAGVQIALDDFGTGYSALSYLTSFDVDYLKIDQAFVHDLIEKPAHRAVASAIIALAHELGMAVIAEGVEKNEQKEWLLRSGCDYAQGFLFSEALPAAAFASLLEQRSLMH